MSGHVVLFDAYPHVYAGAQRLDHELAKRLPDRGWEVTVLVPAEGLLARNLRSDGLRVEVEAAPAALSIYGGATRGWSAVRAATALPRYWHRIDRRLTRLGADVVHVVDHRGLVLAGLAAAIRKRPLVWQIHAINRSARLNRLGARVAHEVLVPTARVLVPMPDLGRAQLTVVPNGVDEALHEREPPPWPTTPLLVTTGRLHPDKGLDVLIRALALVRESCPEVQLEVLGGPQRGFESYLTELQALVATLGLDPAVRFAGHVEDPPARVRQARVYVQASRERTEIVPLAILEAMAVGTPVVATDVGGVAELVTDGVTGRLVQAESPSELAGAILDVLDDDAALALRSAARCRAREPDRTHEHMADLVAATYDRVAVRRRR